MASFRFTRTSEKKANGWSLAKAVHELIGVKQLERKEAIDRLAAEIAAKKAKGSPAQHASGRMKKVEALIEEDDAEVLELLASYGFDPDKQWEEQDQFQILKNWLAKEEEVTP